MNTEINAQLLEFSFWGRSCVVLLTDLTPEIPPIFLLSMETKNHLYCINCYCTQLIVRGKQKENLFINEIISFRSQLLIFLDFSDSHNFERAKVRINPIDRYGRNNNPQTIWNDKVNNEVRKLIMTNIRVTYMESTIVRDLQSEGRKK